MCCEAVVLHVLGFTRPCHASKLQSPHHICTGPAMQASSGANSQRFPHLLHIAACAPELRP